MIDLKLHTRMFNLIAEIPSIDAASIEKKSKKDRKDKKKKSKSLPAETESIVPTETEQVVSATDDSKAFKKKNKKRKHAEVETETVTEPNDEMQVDAEPGDTNLCSLNFILILRASS